MELCKLGYEKLYYCVGERRASDFGLTEIEKLLDSFGGKILTNEKFDRTSFSIFNNFIGQPLPQEDFDGRVDVVYGKTSKKKRWWEFWKNNSYRQ